MITNTVCIPVHAGGTLEVGTSYIFGFRAPEAGNGGGITITSVRFASNEAIAAASAPNLTLVSLGTNSAVNGTVATATGSVAWTAGTSFAGTLSTVFVDAENEVAVMWAQTAENADEPVITCAVQYVMGR